ncbi:MAG: cbb3-type cytochrome c oxidase subunit I [Anaerolineae bacterium]|nr:cbb3-type cytochrome c oxidase subunit I [Anaerolineae bacterium]
MPRLARWYIRTAFLYFAFGFTLGGAMLTDKWLGPHVIFVALRQIHVHYLLVGWMVQFIIGVAYWMFPRFTREQPRGSEPLAWITYAALNVGLLLRGIAEPFLTLGYGGWPGPVLGLSALLQVVAGLLFVANTWQRVRALTSESTAHSSRE